MDHFVNLNYRDRFGIFDSDTNFGFNTHERRDVPQSLRNEFLVNTSLSSRHTVGMFILRPTVFLGSQAIREELVVEEDRIYEYSLGLGLEVPTIKMTMDLKVGQNKLDKAVNDDTKKAFGNLSLRWRPAFLARFNEGTLFVQARVNDFNFTTGSRNFRESSVTVGLNIHL